VLTDCSWPRFWRSWQSTEGFVVNWRCRRLLPWERFALLFHYSVYCIVR